MEETLKAWFIREILVHEAALVRYLRRTWPNGEDVHDLRQEIYIRIYEAAATARPTSPKSFIFVTARNLMADRIRRNRVVSIVAVGDLDVLNVLIEEITPERKLQGRQDLARLAQALDRLPPRCREVVWLRRVDNLPQKEVAELLGMSERTVESHVWSGMRRLADAFFGKDLEAGSSTPSADTDESEHGK